MDKSLRPSPRSSLHGQVQRVRRNRLGIQGGLVLFVLLSISAYFNPPWREIYPFFAWNMFSVVPAPDGMEVHIVAVGYEVLGKPINMLKASEGVRTHHAAAQKKAIRNLKQAYKHRPERFTRVRKNFESTFLLPGTTYELRSFEALPLEHLLGRTNSWKLIGTYQVQ